MSSPPRKSGDCETDEGEEGDVVLEGQTIVNGPEILPSVEDDDEEE